MIFLKYIKTIGMLFISARREMCVVRRFLACALFALCAAGGFGASVMRQSSLPVSGFSDTEAVTNVVFSFAEDVARDFSVRLELDATPSNCVEVAFGRDADGDG